MRLDTKGELFLGSLLEQVRKALVAEARGDAEREWALGARLSQILAAQSHALVAEWLGLALAQYHDTRIEVSVGGVPHASYEAMFIRAELGVGLTESIHSVIDVPVVREEVMSRAVVGDHSLPALIYPDEPEEAGDGEV